MKLDLLSESIDHHYFDSECPLQLINLEKYCFLDIHLNKFTKFATTTNIFTTAGIHFLSLISYVSYVVCISKH